METSCRKRAASMLFAAVAALLVLAQLGYVAAQALSLMLSRSIWPADMANFLRPHLLAVGVGLFVLGVAMRRRSTFAGGVAALAAAVAPYALLPSPAPDLGGRPFTLVSANVLVENPNPGPFLSVPQIASADILVLQEMTSRWQDALSASGHWPHESGADLGAANEMKVYSRFPILGETAVFPESGDTDGRHPIRLELQVGDRVVVVYAIHPQTPRGLAMWRERAAYLRDLAAALRGEAADAAVIVAGDWNTPPWSPFFRDLLATTGYRTTESRWWPSPTRFSVRYGGLTWMGTPIDRVVLSPNVGLVEAATGPKFGSNHLPVVVRLSLP